ncbi:uncharacterized protein LOC143020744 [Oratosquilla oratoria]|uniref:uncharacterized protein LOC143020744 n=1 Tax=Oratosquilla oratoria TaxID=337810 RepID=UPI003F76BBE9
MKYLVLLALVGVAMAQYEGGFVKILEDKRYQDGAAFGNYRNQEDGQKYFEETLADGTRKGYWEYPLDGKIYRMEFEAGKQGMVITKSSFLGELPPAPKAPVVPVLPNPVPVVKAAPVTAAPIPVVRQQPPPTTTTTTTPGPQNLFDYPAHLDFERNAQGHRFKFTAV